MRKEGLLPYGWIADHTRFWIRPRLYSSLSGFLEELSSMYRLDLWASQDSYVEIWIEKRGLVGVVSDVTGKFGVGLMPVAGDPSDTVLYETGETIRDAAEVRGLLAGRPLDLAVVNAGLALGTDRIHTGDPADWDVVIDTNIKGVLHVLRAVTPGMVDREHGDVVLLGSVAGRHVYPGGNVYCASEHAVRALYESLRQDLEGHNLRFSTVDPGLVETEFSEVRFKGDAGRAATVYQGFEALRPEDVADAIAYVVTRPAHVNIGELVLWPTAQASVTSVTKR